MKFRINTGRHRAFPPLLWFIPWKRSICKTVVFDSSCRYDLGNDDQHDINKLFGFAFVPFWRYVWIGISLPVFALLNRNRQHKYSARYGWNYDLGKMKIVLHQYTYVNGVRYSDALFECFFGKEYKCKITLEGGKYWFDIREIDFDGSEKTPVYFQIEAGHNYKWAIPLGAYFGGNQKAPHRMTIKMK